MKKLKLLATGLIACGALLLAACTASASSTPVKPAEPRNRNGIRLHNRVTLRNFKKIKISSAKGSSVKEVKRLFGKEADYQTKRLVLNKQVNAYTWNDVAGSDIGSCVVIDFLHGHAVQKTITGLRTRRPHIIDRERYAKVTTGTSSKDLVETLGKPNTVTYTSLDGKVSETWGYTSQLKGSGEAKCLFILKNSQVVAKSQTHLE